MHQLPLVTPGMVNTVGRDEERMKGICQECWKVAQRHKCGVLLLIESLAPGVSQNCIPLQPQNGISNLYDGLCEYPYLLIVNKSIFPKVTFHWLNLKSGFYIDLLSISLCLILTATHILSRFLELFGDLLKEHWLHHIPNLWLVKICIWILHILFNHPYILQILNAVKIWHKICKYEYSVQ